MHTPILCFATACFALATFQPDLANAAPPECKIIAEGEFAQEKVRRGKGAEFSDNASIAVFKAPLAVNTDGAPNSYHPQDFLGERLAINRLDNGIAIRKNGRSVPTAEKAEVFKRWRDSGWTVPTGYSISWTNVIAAGPNGKPCVFSTGDYAGYFGSLTGEQNGLAPRAAGECAVKNQQDLRYIPAIALRGTQNPMIAWGAKTGDLVLALNPANGVMVPAIIGDSGDGNRIGEGSVALNMALLRVDKQPTKYSETLALDTRSQDIVVAVLPSSRTFQRNRPHTAANIAQRVEAWAAANGYGSTKDLSAFAEACARGL